jgi:N-acetylglutamate synthase-like GNAT family acetyltransferase
VPIHPEFFSPGLARSGEFLVAEIDGALQGFACMDAASSELRAVFISPQAHGRGVGATLVRRLEARARELGVRNWSVMASLNAEAFYGALGFRVLSRTVWHHPNGFDLPCVKMEKVLAL